MHIYTHAQYLEHQVASGHPERPDRLRAVLDHLDRIGMVDDVPVREPRTAVPADVARVHPEAHVAFLESMRPTEGVVPVDPDTWLSPGSLPAAFYAAGALCDATRDVLSGDGTRVFCAVRPPGHHAERAAAMGFCLFNNVAIGATLALEDPAVDRVAVLDFDVHHGNGTVDVFRDDPRVLVCSSFQHPFYPNRLHDVSGPNLVYTPLDAGTDGTTFRHAIERDWLPALQAHQPDLIYVSAGFDAHVADPLASLCLTEADFAWITREIVAAANESAKGRIVSALEGGYDLQALASSVEAHLSALLD